MFCVFAPFGDDSGDIRYPQVPVGHPRLSMVGRLRRLFDEYERGGLTLRYLIVI